MTRLGGLCTRPRARSRAGSNDSKGFGIDGLEPQHKGSRPRTATPSAQAKVCRKLQQKPEDGSIHWSVRKLAADMGVSKSSVHRIWSQPRCSRIGWTRTAGSRTDPGALAKPIFPLRVSGSNLYRRWMLLATIRPLSETRCKCCQALLSESIKLT